ncbi:MAG: SH3 domain-containing protein [Deltaproteobacteria bacterium]|nr:SH3 domain-containing protein [Deltaproteobacteria bacterium]
MQKQLPIRSISIILVGLFAFTLLLPPNNALAVRGHKRRVVLPPHGTVVAKLPPGHRGVRVGKSKYFYHRGAFYRKRHRGFVVVKAPVGAIVAGLAVGFTTAVIGSLTYYAYGGTYYRQVPSGYMVVEPPAATVVVRKSSCETSPAKHAGDCVFVRAHSLNVRSGPGKNHRVVRKVHRGNILTIRGHAPGWIYVKLPSGRFGWVMKKYTRPLSSRTRG